MSLLMRSYRFPFDTVREELEKMVSDEFPFFGWAPLESAFPPVNVYEKEDSMVLEFEAPGMKIEDTELTITGGSVTLKMKRGVEGDIPPEKYYVRERLRGEFGRTVTVPGTVDSTKATAAYRNGILAVTIPKAEEARAKRVAVNVEEESEVRLKTEDKEGRK
jgi:HSP20 family protein